MRKAVKKADFFFDGYDTFFLSSDKKLAGAILEYLGTSVPKIIEKPASELKMVHKIVSDVITLETSDDNLALLVYEYLDKNVKNPLKETIKALKEKLANDK